MKKYKIKPKLVIIPLLVIGIVYLIWWWLRNRTTQISQLSASNPTYGTGVGGASSGFDAPPVQSFDVSVGDLPPFDESKVVVAPGTSGSGLPGYSSQAQLAGTSVLPGFRLGPSYGDFDDSLGNIASAFDPNDIVHFASAGSEDGGAKSGDACCSSCETDCSSPNSTYVDGAGSCLSLDKQQLIDGITHSKAFPALTQRVYNSAYGKYVDQLITDPSVYANYYPDANLSF